MQDTGLKIRSFISENFLFGRADEALADDDSLIEQGVIDSTGVLLLVAFLEKECGVHVEDEDIVPENLDTISRLAAFVSRKRPLEGNANAPISSNSSRVACDHVAANLLAGVG